jgi:hypothetical protein
VASDRVGPRRYCTETSSRASPSCCPPASAGPSCPPSWATARTGPAGGACTNRPRPACVRPAARRRAQPARRARRAGLVEGVPGLGRRPGEKGGELTGPNPTDRAKRGSKYHLLVDAAGLPLNVAVSGANRNDSMLVELILDSMPAIRRGGRGHPRRRPIKLHADKGYDIPRVRRHLRRRGIAARIARIGRDSSARLAGTAGSSNAPSAGCCPTNASPCATTAARSASPRWPEWPSPSSAPDGSPLLMQCLLYRHPGRLLRQIPATARRPTARAAASPPPTASAALTPAARRARRPRHPLTVDLRRQSTAASSWKAADHEARRLERARVRYRVKLSNADIDQEETGMAVRCHRHLAVASAGRKSHLRTCLNHSAVRRR